MIVLRALVVAVALSTVTMGARGQLLQQDFTEAATAPAGWSLSGTGAYRRALRATGTGDDTSYWWRSVRALRPSSTYRLRFTARVLPGSASSTVIAGLDCCNRDFGVTTRWQSYTFAFTTPADVSRAVLRLGQWHLKGTVEFANVALTATEPVYTHQGGVALGEGEGLAGGEYRFAAPLSSDGSNSARSLWRHTALFNSNRWVLGGGAEVIYRHQAGRLTQTGARLAIEVNYRTAGQCIVSVSKDGAAWTDIAALDRVTATTIDVPAALFPTSAIWVRMRGSQGAELQVDRYVYTARVSGAGVGAAQRADGATRFVEVARTDPRVAVSVTDLGLPGRAAPQEVRLAVRPSAGVNGLLGIMLVVRPETGGTTTSTRIARVSAGRQTTIGVPYALRHAGRARLSLLVNLMTPQASRLCYSASAELYLPAYHAADYGYALTQVPEGRLWWCEGTYKVSPWRPAPAGDSEHRRVAPLQVGRGIRLALAGRESGAAQLVLAAGAAPGPMTVRATELKGTGGTSMAASCVRVRRVAYVHVSTPTDAIGVADDWPDPLPPLEGAWQPVAGRNNPLWLTVTVPAGQRAGDYDGWVVLQGKGTTRVPLRVHVWGFSLPARTALRSGFGISPEAIARYHNLSSASDIAAQWDLYMRDFARHRLCPYNPMALAPLPVERAKEPGEGVSVDWRAFDTAGRTYLDELGLNSFTMSVAGLGGGRYPNYDRGSFLGAAAGSPEYDRLMGQYGGELVEHLRARGWLDKAYVYWYDEPEESDYPFVVEGMQRLRRYAPGLRRMLTEEFQPPLYGNVDLWCPITPNYRPGPAAARQKLGEEVWWYVCTGPKEPWVGLFIDHPAVELRMWLWQTWKYRVQGILIWDTTYWTSPPQFPREVQNPWQDPMSYVSGPSGVWGNGDGRFFYPPNRRPNDDRTTRFVTEPIDSIRWEMLGEGVEDWEYFHALSGLASEARRRGLAASEVKKAEQLLEVPASICSDMTHYATDPRPMYAHRARLAGAIERLSTKLGAERG